MRLVIVESPYAGDLERNILYARRALCHAFSLGEAPFASHLLYTQPGILRDEVPAERRRGIEAGWEWMLKADAVVVYADYGYSSGMTAGLKWAIDHEIPVETRFIGQNP